MTPMTPMSPATPAFSRATVVPVTLFPSLDPSGSPGRASRKGESQSHAMRLLLVRHAQSGNKAREPGQKACADPDLSDLGYEQAEALGSRLAREFSRGSHKRGGLTVVSSPMRRCLLTILPAVRRLALPVENCFCHGACFEYGCAGKRHVGTAASDIEAEFPQFQAIGFNEHGLWDYRGNSLKENELECRERGERIKEWLTCSASSLITARSACVPPTLIMVTHQTIADLLCHLLLEGTADRWVYGDIRYRLQNACITELLFHSDGRVTFGTQNDSVHLLSFFHPRGKM